MSLIYKRSWVWRYAIYSILTITGIYGVVNELWLGSLLWLIVVIVAVVRLLIFEVLYAELDQDGNLLLKTVFKSYKLKCNQIDEIKTTRLFHTVIAKDLNFPFNKLVIFKEFPYSDELPLMAEVKSRIS